MEKLYITDSFCIRVIGKGMFLYGSDGETPYIWEGLISWKDYCTSASPSYKLEIP
jgi:hypothetical protein